MFGVAFVFLASFALFVRTLAPSFGTDDVPEMVLAALNLDVTHPPGYPLYVLAGRLFALLPLGSPSFRLNLMSAAAAAGAVALLFSAARTLGRNAGLPRFHVPVWPLLGAAALATSHTWWWQATQADKYALGLLLAAGFLRAALATASPALLALLAGVCLAHHPLLLFILPLAWPRFRNARLKPAAFLACAFLFLLPLSLKPVYTAIRANANPPSNWGEPRNASSLWSYLGVRVYGQKMAPAPAVALRRFGPHLGFYPHQLGPAGSALAAASAVSLGVAFPSLAIPLMLSFIGTFLFALQFRLDPFLVETYHGLNILLLCLGLGAGFPRLPRRIPRGALLVLGLAALFVHIAFRAPAYDASRAFLLRDLNLNILRSAPRNALVFAGSDYDHFALLYLTGPEGLRPDVRIQDLPLQLRRRSYWADIRSALGSQGKRAGSADSIGLLTDAVNSSSSAHCVCFTVFSEPFLPLPAVAVGPLLIARRSDCAPGVPPGITGWRACTFREAFSPPAAQLWNRFVLSAEARSLEMTAGNLAPAGRLEEALQCLARACRLAPGASSFTARGLILGQSGRPVEALGAFEEASRLEPGALEPYALAFDLIRSRRAWRALPALVKRVRTGLNLVITGKGPPPELARELAVALADEARRREAEAMTGGDMLPGDPRRVQNARHYHILAEQLLPGRGR